MVGKWVQQVWAKTFMSSRLSWQQLSRLYNCHITQTYSTKVFIWATMQWMTRFLEPLKWKTLILRIWSWCSLIGRHGPNESKSQRDGIYSFKYAFNHKWVQWSILSYKKWIEFIRSETLKIISHICSQDPCSLFWVLAIFCSRFWFLNLKTSAPINWSLQLF